MDNPETLATLTTRHRTIQKHSEIQLKPKSVELQRSLNRQAHKTSFYEIPNLILRRGQSFDVSITFDRTFSEAFNYY
jgi:hypothetical protein